MSCGREHPPSPRLFRCPACGGPLEVIVDPPRSPELRGRGVWRYRDFLPLAPGVRPVTMGEGSTPHIELRSAPGKAYLKFEGLNPTGSFKDRGMTVGVTIARAAGARGVVVASTGNTAASAAAYAARAGLECLVYLPRGGVAGGKLFQVRLHGARLVEVEGFFDDALEIVLQRHMGGGEYYPLNSVNPWRLEGQKTAAMEVWEELGEVDTVVVPVGNGGNIYAIWKGFAELAEAGLARRVPRMVGVQAEGASPIYATWRSRSSRLLEVRSPSTVASAIRIGRPANWAKAIKAVEASGGFMVTVSDREILDALKKLAREEGVGVEPSSAASLAGYTKALEEGLIDRDEVAVLVATGHALKDPSVLELL